MEGAIAGSLDFIALSNDCKSWCAASGLMKRALGDHIFPRYVELKRKEWNEYRVQVTEWEKDKYLAAL